MARLNMAQAARHVADSAEPTRSRPSGTRCGPRSWRRRGRSLGASMEVDAAEPNDGLLQVQPAPPHRVLDRPACRPTSPPVLLFRQAIGVMDQHHGRRRQRPLRGHHLRAHRRDVHVCDDALLHLRQWRDYRVRTDAGGATDNAPKCGVDHPVRARTTSRTRRSADSEIADPAGHVRAAGRGYPLPVADRPPTDFLWQRPPTQLNGHADRRATRKSATTTCSPTGCSATTPRSPRRSSSRSRSGPAPPTSRDLEHHTCLEDMG